MRRRWPLNFQKCFVAAACVACGGLGVFADEQSTPDGYKISTVNVGGKVVQVKEVDPYRNVKPPPPPDGKYHPTDLNFSAVNPMSDKKFALPSDSLTKSDPEFANGGQNSFVTKSYEYDASAPTVPNLNTKASFPTTTAYSRTAPGYDKSFMTASADAGQNRSAAFESNTSSYQGRTAVLGGQNVDTFADPLAAKKFEGPEADAAHRHLTKLPNGQMEVTDLPDRPLTIDEVRDLINHGFKPNTEAPPPEPSKPLNDPGYKPQPLRETPPPEPLNDDDKNDPVPPPGTMAAPQAPENSEPLPQP